MSILFEIMAGAIAGFILAPVLVFGWVLIDHAVNP